MRETFPALVQRFFVELPKMFATYRVSGIVESIEGKKQFVCLIQAISKEWAEIFVSTQLVEENPDCKILVDSCNVFFVN